MKLLLLLLLMEAAAAQLRGEQQPSKLSPAADPRSDAPASALKLFAASLLVFTACTRIQVYKNGSACFVRVFWSLMVETLFSARPLGGALKPDPDTTIHP